MCKVELSDPTSYGHEVDGKLNFIDHIADHGIEPYETFAVKRTNFTTKPLDVRLRTDLYAAVVAAAERRGIPYQMLVQTWLREKVLQEAPDLAPQR